MSEYVDDPLTSFTCPSIDQSIDQSINQSINQSIHRRTQTPRSFFKSAGEATPWQSSTGKPVAFDIPKDTKVTITFPTHENKTVELAIRNAEQNEDEEGVANMRPGGMTNYFIFPGESGQDPEWLKGEDWRGMAVVSFDLGDGKTYKCDPFVLVPHEVL
jgi:hypothetical protein